MKKASSFIFKIILITCFFGFPSSGLVAQKIKIEYEKERGLTSVYLKNKTGKSIIVKVRLKTIFTKDSDFQSSIMNLKIQLAPYERIEIKDKSVLTFSGSGKLARNKIRKVKLKILKKWYGNE